MKHVSKKEAEAEIKNGTAKVAEDDLKRILEKREEIEARFSGSGPLGKFIADVKILMSMVQDYWNGTYREIPWTSIASIVVALLYVLNPIDLIPDFIPVIGQLDDAAVIAACLALVDHDLKSYVAWKKRNA